jgi:hypothetical protein
MLKNKNTEKAWVILLMILNVMVLTGQLWPEGAPPFARMVNLIFLFSNFVFLIVCLKNQEK